MRTLRSLAPAMALILLVGACGDDDAATTITTMATTTTSATTSTAATTTTAPSETTTTTAAPDGRFVTTDGHPDYGEILIDQDGFTLYLFTQDTQDGDDSACLAPCSTTWPPLEDGNVAPGPGTDPELFGTIERSDGIVQVTYNGWPLYYFSGDTQPGDTNGQGVGGLWFVVSPDGEPVME